MLNGLGGVSGVSCGDVSQRTTIKAMHTEKQLRICMAMPTETRTIDQSSEDELDVNVAQPPRYVKILRN